MVRIEVRNSVKGMGDKSLFVSFDFSYAVLDIIKALPTRIYEPKTKEWEVPTLLLDRLKAD